MKISPEIAEQNMNANVLFDSSGFNMNLSESTIRHGALRSVAAARIRQSAFLSI